MGKVRSWARRWALRVGALGRTARNRLYFALGGPGSMEIVPFRGYGTHDRLVLMGRVLADKGLAPARETDRLWRNLRNMRKRVFSRPIPGARLRLTVPGHVAEVETDALGYFRAELSVPPDPGAPGPFRPVGLTLLSPLNRRQGPVTATAQVRVPGPRTRFVVVSDIDDTVVRTGATSLLSLARESFTGNAYSRVPFPGVAALYRALRDGVGGHEDNPLFFVSRSPWNLYDLFEQFFEIHGISDDPVIFLRQWGLSEEGLTRASLQGLKYRNIRRMLALYPELPFILLGDSGQKDPEIYREVIRAHPGQVKAVYIRSVHPQPERQEAVWALAREVEAQGSRLVLADDSLAIARDAVAQGFIPERTLAEIGEARDQDQAGEPRPGAEPGTIGPGA